MCIRDSYFDSSVQFQLSFVNLSASQETFARSISIPPCGDEFDGIRAEYAGMLQNQLARGNNGLIKTKYLTFGITSATAAWNSTFSAVFVQNNQYS